MPNANTHDTITFVCVPLTYLAAEMYWGGNHTLSVIATVALLFAGLMFGPDLDLQSRPYSRWGPLRIIWKPYQVALPHRSVLSHGPVLGTIIRIVYFLVMFSVVAATLLYVRHVYLRGQQTTWTAEFNMVKGDLFSFWKETDRQYFEAGFIGLCLGALSHTAADMIWSAVKRGGSKSKRRRR
ncbi:MAG TPA: metal-binding protein [Blastocatellia bacterium]|nr:metal-binding protein [Blastocatellia bacterium]HMV81609.1 metal-binding protein [Blastocatellia bacterium]HMY71555.1 metal-binding protein [Blastocatellia bacterium]HMZ23016.1 metal-binding protein [Blastocatellia bacterium]HNG31501.1 metal-binding protein [Blastocatellia bacterium]